jgi:hypothetical protein
MVRKKVLKEIIEAIYSEFGGRCAPLAVITEHLKEKGVGAAYSTIRAALKVMVREGRAEKFVLHKAYTVYCFGSLPEPELEVRAGGIENCIMNLAPSATFLRIAECALGRKVERNATGVYLMILYALLQMVKEDKIKSFTVFTDAQNRPKVVVRK